MVPAEWFEATPISIAMTGARAAGKTVLMAVMMTQFEHFLEQQHHEFLTPLGATEADFKWYTDALYTERKVIAPTVPVATNPGTLNPLMWSFRMGGRDYCLSIVDAAGEDLEGLSPDNTAFAYLGHVDMIVSLVDPTKVPAIAAVLEDIIEVPGAAGNDIDVLRRVLAARRRHAPDNARQCLAIAISKFDVLQALRGSPTQPWQTIMNRPGAAMQRDPSMTRPSEDADDWRLLQEEVRGLLLQLGEQMMMAAARDAGIPSRFFAVSALGMTPQSEALAFGGITPYRVIDLVKAAVAWKAAEQ